MNDECPNDETNAIAADGVKPTCHGHCSAKASLDRAGHRTKTVAGVAWPPVLEDPHWTGAAPLASSGLSNSFEQVALSSPWQKPMEVKDKMVGAYPCSESPDCLQSGTVTALEERSLKRPDR
jgi:hypothetical protein